MKALINLFIEDLKEEGFTSKDYMKYGVVASLIFILMFVLENLIDTL